MEPKTRIGFPVFAYGTGSALMKSDSDGELDRNVIEQIKTAINLGFTHFDTAEAYHTERELGIAIEESFIPRERLFVTTKTLGYGSISQALDSSLKKLQLEYVDLYLLHIPWIETHKSLQEAWSEMEAVKASGKVKLIGVSNFAVTDLEKILDSSIEVPAVNQIEFSIYLQRKELYSFCQKHQIALQAFAPLSPCTVAAGGPAGTLLSSLSTKYATTEAVICLRWCIDMGLGVVTTSHDVNRLKEYMRIFEFRMTPGEVEELSGMGAGKHFRKYFSHRFAADDRS
ncbi:hypothetical protein EYC80_009604 [Monilinia laxa]|uniref:NADP-dependent oxidoreductase domain-containing protein n=1 Tax=Monilinia laxa TaxID=61186 RepID=A0A5N6JYD0_MONLA|nr:hypothetical protein EYC80_009604 [Monilinia laxa]